MAIKTAQEAIHFKIIFFYRSAQQKISGITDEVSIFEYPRKIWHRLFSGNAANGFVFFIQDLYGITHYKVIIPQ
jgi:hypothetical protein